MKVLAVAEFDPANVLGGHRAALRAAGVDYRLAVHLAYRDPVPHGAPDWWNGREGRVTLDPSGTRAELKEFASSADVVIWSPAIGQPWSCTDGEAPRADDPQLPLRRDARHVAYFHGSRNLQQNLDWYVDRYRAQGCALWFSTLNYVAAVPGSRYAPPAIDAGQWPRARLRDDGERLVIVQAPTDPGNCHTAMLHDDAGGLDAVVNVVRNQRHADVLRHKSRAHLGFDHLRGGFSVNTVENMAVGLAPCFRLSRAEHDAFEAELGPVPGEWPVQYAETPQPLRELLAAQAARPDVTRRAQASAREFAAYFAPGVVAARLLELLDA